MNTRGYTSGGVLPGMPSQPLRVSRSSARALSVREAAAQGRAALPQGPACTALLPSLSRNCAALLSGDGTVTAVVKQNDAKDIVKICSALLRSLPMAQRRDAVSTLSARISGPVIDMVPIASLIPSDITVEQTAAVLNGFWLMLLALGTASKDTSVGTVCANAASMATGAPMASDPMVGERQNEVMLAKAILEAALLGDEEAAKWFADHKLSAALSRVARSSQTGAVADSGVVQAAVDSAFDLYDCMHHLGPLGGDTLGERISSFLSDAWKNAGDGSTAREHATGQGATAGGSSMPSGSHQSGLGVKAATVEAAASARDALREAREAMQQGMADIQDYQAKMKTASLDAARLSWAEQMLSASDEVANLLARVSPNASSVAPFLQSALALLPAAKNTGDVSTLRSLLYSLRAAASSGEADSSSILGMLSGDAGELGGSIGVSDTFAPNALARYRSDAQFVRGESAAPANVVDQAAEGTTETDNPVDLDASVRSDMESWSELPEVEEIDQGTSIAERSGTYEQHDV